MKNYNKIVVLSLLFLIIFSFSGCSIQKVEEEKGSVTPNLPKQDIKKTDIDSDGDGLFDNEEKEYGTDINRSDTDSDGLTDFEEVINWKTDPLVLDTDGDGYSDGQEVEGGYNPLGSG